MYEKQLAAAISAGELAKRKILEIYKTDFTVEKKSDNSPVTIADKESDKIIREYLERAYPDYEFLSEEVKDDKRRLDADYVWIVDPLDGTCNFVKHNDQFTINIALVKKHKVVVSVIIVPVTNEIYYASKHAGAFYSKNGSVREIHVSRRTKDLRAALSASSHGKKEESFYKKYGNKIVSKEFIGASLKACKIAIGEADIAIALNNKTHEWDTAAGTLLVKEAGGIFLDSKLNEIVYNRKNTVNENGYFIVNKKRNII